MELLRVLKFCGVKENGGSEIGFQSSREWLI